MFQVMSYGWGTQPKSYGESYNSPNKMQRGRPLKFKTVEELQGKIDEYFEVTPYEELTITGLAIHLDTFRDLLCDYQKKDNFSDTIKKAKQKIENAYERRLIKRGNGGDIFALKNFGWKDENYHDVTSGGKPIPILGANVSTNDSNEENNRTEEED